MDRHKKEQQLLTRGAEIFALPSDIVAGLPHMELLGDSQFFLDGHDGLLSYGTEQIDISAGGLVIRICGAELSLRAMTQQEVRITGRIDSVQFIH